MCVQVSYLENCLKSVLSLSANTAHPILLISSPINYYANKAEDELLGVAAK